MKGLNGNLHMLTIRHDLIARLLLQAFWALVFACAVGLAQAQGTKRLALVIGNDSYRSIERLANARNDARLMEGVLRRAGFDVTLATDLDRERLWRAIDIFKSRIGKGDDVVFYFAGHGVQIGSNQLLLPVDINAQNEGQVGRDGVSLVDVQDALKDARFGMFVIDACRDNPFPKQGTRSIGGTRGLSPPEPAAGQVIVMSAGRNQKALDSVPGSAVKNGLFTYELAQVLQQPGLEVRRALEQVQERVDDKAKRESHEQRPSLVNDLRGNFFFFGPTSVAVTSAVVTPAPAPSAVAPSRDPEEEAWIAAQRVNSERAYSAFVAAYPAGRFTPAARIALSGFAQQSAQSGAASGQPAPAAPPSTAASTMGAPPGTVIKDCTDCPEMVVIAPGSFTMGSPASEEGRDVDEGPQRRVTIGYSFAVGKHEVTRGEYARFVQETSRAMGGSCYWWTGDRWDLDSAKTWRTPGFAQTDAHPVVCVDWHDAKAYAAWLSAKTGKSYRLLSEAEWEYVARAGTTTPFNTGRNISPNQANFNHGESYAGSARGSWLKKTVPVGGFAPNAFGLHDMHGNVWEWTEDCWNDSYDGAPSDGRAWTSGDCSRRAARGGSWDFAPKNLRSADRIGFTGANRVYFGGFRVARTP